MQIWLILLCVAGIVIGVRFNVLVLFPLTVLGAIAFQVNSWLLSPESQSGLGSVVVLIISFQAGYFVGVIGRDVFNELSTRLLSSPTKRV